MTPINTKHLAVLDEAKAELPAGLVDLTNVPGIGPKRARLLYDKLKVRSVADLGKAVEAGKLHGLAGFGVICHLIAVNAAWAAIRLRWADC